MEEQKIKNIKGNNEEKREGMWPRHTKSVLYGSGIQNNMVLAKKTGKISGIELG